MKYLSNIGASTKCNANPNPSFWTYARKQTLTLTKNAREIAWIQKAISDSRFHYNIFADKTHDRTNFKNYITDYWFLTSYSLTFNPACETREILTSAVTFSHILSFYFEKRVKM